MSKRIIINQFSWWKNPNRTRVFVVIAKWLDGNDLGDIELLEYGMQNTIKVNAEVFKEKVNEGKLIEMT